MNAEATARRVKAKSLLHLPPKLGGHAFVGLYRFLLLGPQLTSHFSGGFLLGPRNLGLHPNRHRVLGFAGLFKNKIKTWR